MVLTDKVRRKIEEEEKHRYNVREKIKQKKANRGFLGCLALLVILVALAALSSGDSSNSPPDDQSSNQVPVVTAEQISGWARQYCSGRKAIYFRKFPVLDKIIETANMDDLILKKGSELTNEDCKTNINALITLGFEDNLQKVIEGTVWVGMNVIELAVALGGANDVNTGVYGGYKSEQWVYNKDSYGSAIYVYVDNGVVTSWQDF